jgi:ABC-type transport system involved in cytochrome c biogenesis permease subunit
VLAFKKRGAIVLIHAGVALMMFNELYVGMTSAEAQMRMTPGAVHNYVEDIRTVELAVVDSAGKTENSVVVVPKQMLFPNNVIRDERLPFDVKVVEFMQNADIRRPVPKGQANLATAGLGLEWYAVPERAGTGTDTDSKVDISAAYVTLEKKGTDEPLGTYLVSLEPEETQSVTVEGKNYDVALRFKRTYKPFMVQLLEARKDNYPGTDTPRNFSSDIHLIDPTNRTDRDNIHIWMNNPLRYNGETFYQSGFGIDPKSGEPQTTLTVVANRGWMIPYIGCMIVAVGLLSHFLTVLTRFLRRRASGSLDPRDESEPAVPLAELAREKILNRSWSSMLGEFFPWVAVAVLVGWALSFAVPPPSRPDALNFYKFGELPVVYEGRVKPFDTLARNALKAISEKQTWTDSDPQDGTSVERRKHQHPAIEWLLDVICDPEVAANEPVFHIDDSELRDMLGLTAKQTTAEKNLAARSSDKNAQAEQDKAAIAADESFLRRRKDNRYSIADFRDGLKEFGKQWKQADSVVEAERTPLQRQIVEFARRLSVYRAVQDSFQPLDLPPLPSAEEIRKDPEGARAVAEEIGRMLREDMPKFHADLAQRQVPLSVPPENGNGEWEPFATAIDQAFIDRVIHGSEGNPNTVALAGIFHDYVKRNAAEFNASVAKYAASLVASPPKLMAESNNSSLWIVPVVSRKLGLIQHADKLDFEAFFNHFEPFFYGMILYLVAFSLACFALLGWSVPLNRAAFWLVAATLVLHTAAMIGRIYISGRPPVTNLYSAALFIGWAGVGMGLLLEVFFGLGLGTLIGALAGFMTLLIAHFLASSGDTFTVMQAVLDTQFWLATHVVCITLGYATTFFAGLLGVLYVVLGVLTPALSPSQRRITPRSKGLAVYAALTGGLTGIVAHDLATSSDRSKTIIRMIYGVLCFAIFFSFVGTVLGGLWADDSWGRFWGWDPKENGALIIVIWNALVLHARWDGIVKDRGLAVLAIGGNIAVAWSGFGVNELGAGLHSYGFTNGVALWLSIFVASQLALIIMGSLPKRLWRSFRNPPHPATA